MNTNDVSKLSYAQLLDLSKELDQQIAAKRAEELKALADGYIKKMEAAGFSAAEAVDALKPYLKNSPAKQRTTSAAAVLYQDPANPTNTWSGRGRAAKWLADYEAQGRLREDFRVRR